MEEFQDDGDRSRNGSAVCGSLGSGGEGDARAFSGHRSHGYEQPPGNETLVAEYLKQVLERKGISARLLALDPKRANLVARIRGNGSKRPILVMGHTDSPSMSCGTTP